VGKKKKKGNKTKKKGKKGGNCRIFHLWGGEKVSNIDLAKKKKEGKKKNREPLNEKGGGDAIA